MSSADGPERDDHPAGEGTPPGRPVFVNPDLLAPPDGAPVFVNRKGQAFTAEGAAQRIDDPDGPVFVTKPLPPVQDEDRPWGWFVGPSAVLIAFMAVVFLGVFVAAIAGAGSGTETSSEFLDDNEHWLGLAQDAIWIAVALVVPYLFVRHLRPEQLGLRRPPRMARAIGVLVGLLILFYGLAAVYASVFGLNEDSNQLLQDTGFGDSLTKDIASAILFTVAAPVAEELLFRGLLFRSLRDGFQRRFGNGRGLALGAVVSGVIFGAIHVGGGQDDFLPVLMVLGILLALAYHWSGSIYVSMAIHSINNAIATGSTSHPKEDWVYGLIYAGPIITVILAVLIGRFVASTFPADRPAPNLPDPSLSYP